MSMISGPPLSARETRTLRSAGAVQIAPGGAPLRGPAKNPLLVRDCVGSAKPSTYELPHENFSYGRPCNQDLEGAREVSMRWVSHHPSPDMENAAPDFVNFNRKACGAKITTAKDLKHFRHERDVVVAAQPYPTPRVRSASQGPGRNLPSISDMLPEGFTHGRKVRPSTPIGQVISCRFAERSERELYNFYTEYREVTDIMQTQVRKIPLTTASRGHASTARKFRQQQTDETKELFKMKKFERVPHKVSTRRKANLDGLVSPEVSEIGGDDIEVGGRENHVPSVVNDELVSTGYAEDPWARDL